MSVRKSIVPAGLGANKAFAPGVQIGELLFISGQVSWDNHGNVVGTDDCEAQVRQIMSRIRTIAEAAGATLQDVVKFTIYLTDVKNYPMFNKVRCEMFPVNPPASSALLIAGFLRPEFLVEIEAIVQVPSNQ